jgi:NAD(P)-dependent dehydrogenase (short-subunit alcohol dehydrogenase family)
VERGEQVDIEVVASSSLSQLSRFHVRAVHVDSVGFAMAGLYRADSFIVLTDDGQGIARIVQENLQLHGISSIVSDRVPDSCTGIVFLGGLRAIWNESEAIQINREAFDIARQAAKRFEQEGGVFVTVQNTGGDFGLSGNAGDRAWLAGISGLAKTAAREWPKASVKAMDIACGEQSPEQIAQTITRELLAGGPELEVGYLANGQRIALTIEESKVGSGARVVDEHAVIVASGGARGVTAEALLALAKATNAQFVLLGRTPLSDEPDACHGLHSDAELKRALLGLYKLQGQDITPVELNRQVQQIVATREINHTMNSLKLAGSNVRYLAVDVQDAEALQEQLSIIREQWGPITGIVHAAGVLADKKISEKTNEQFDRVFDTKIKGLLSLLQATRQEPLKLICLFSSVAARTGNVGQCDYAMANEILNKVAAAEALRREGKCQVKSINWGPWDGGMVNPLLRKHFAQMGVALIPLAEGAQSFVQEVQGGNPEEVEIVIGGKPGRQGLFSEQRERSWTMEINVHQSTHAYLYDHRIELVPVLPVVLVMDWFIRMAASCRPDQHVLSCKDVQVLKGCKLEQFETTGDKFILHCKELLSEDSDNNAGSEGTRHGTICRMILELKSEYGVLYYRGIVELSSQESKLSADPLVKLQDLEASPWSQDQLYDDLLFHGDQFQAIEQIEGVSSSAATAILMGTANKLWNESRLVTDPLLLDGGLQLALLWGKQQTGLSSLPTKIGAYIAYRQEWPTVPVRCLLSGNYGKLKTTSTLVFVTDEGEKIAELVDVEMHMIYEEPWKKRVKGGHTK